MALRVARVWLDGVHGRDEVLIEEELTDVRDVQARVRAVRGEDTVSLVNHDVDVLRAPGVVAREDGDELGNTIGVRLLHTTQESGVL